MDVFEYDADGLTVESVVELFVRRYRGGIWNVLDSLQIVVCRFGDVCRIIGEALGPKGAWLV